MRGVLVTGVVYILCVCVCVELATTGLRQVREPGLPVPRE